MGGNVFTIMTVLHVTIRLISQVQMHQSNCYTRTECRAYTYHRVSFHHQKLEQQLVHWGKTCPTETMTYIIMLSITKYEITTWTYFLNDKIVSSTCRSARPRERLYDRFRCITCARILTGYSPCRTSQFCKVSS